MNKIVQGVKKCCILPTKHQALELLGALLCGLACSGLWAMGRPWLASAVPVCMLIRLYKCKKWLVPTILVGIALVAIMLLETVVDAYYVSWFLPAYKALGLGLVISLGITPMFVAWINRTNHKETCEKCNKNHAMFPTGAFFVAMLIPLLGFWATKAPYIDAFDLQYQLEMLHGEVPLNDVHTMAHTFLLWLVTGQPVVLVGLQIVGLAWLLTAFGAWFYRRGIGLFSIAAVFLMFSLCGTVAEIAASPIKDLPATLCMGVVLYYIMRLLADDLQWRWWHIAAFGAALAFTGLLRHNGYVLVLVAGVWLLAVGLRKKQMFSVLACCVVCIMLVNGIGYQLLHVKSPSNGFSVQVYATGIIAVDRRGGEITEEQRQRMEHLLPMDYVEHCLSNPDTAGRTLAQRLCWTRDLGQYMPSEREQQFAEPLQDKEGTNDVFNNLFILAAGEHKAEIVKLYLELFLKNPWLCTTELIRNTTTIWRLDRGLVLFSHALYLLGLMVAFVSVGSKGMLRYWPVLLPILCNVTSIVVAASTDEIRYLLPTFVLTMPTILFLVVQMQQQESE